MWPWPFPDILGARGRCKGQEHEVFDTHVVPLPQLAKESPDVGGNAMDETTGKWDPNSPPRIAKRLGMALMEAVGDLWLVAVRGKIWGKGYHQLCTTAYLGFRFGFGCGFGLDFDFDFGFCKSRRKSRCMLGT